MSMEYGRYRIIKEIDNRPQCCIKKMAKGWQTHMGVKAIPH
jgi:hypothetical protein